MEYTNWNSIQVKDWMSDAICSINRGAKRTSLELINRAIERDPNNAESWYWKGIILGIIGESVANIRECYNRSLQIDPQYGQSWFLKGIIQAALRHFCDAIECFENAIKFLPRDSYHRIRSLTHFSGYQIAPEYCDEILKMNAYYFVDPCEHTSKFGLNFFPLDIYDKVKSIMQFDDYQMFDEFGVLSNDDDILNRTELEIELNARKCFELYTQLDPENVVGWNNKGLSELSLGCDASYTFNRALSINPKNCIVLKNKALCLFKMRKWDEALEYLARAITNKEMVSNKNPYSKSLRKEFQSGEVFDTHFEVLDAKRGSMGIIYLCNDHGFFTRFNRRVDRVALKMIRKEYLADEKSRIRFNEEGRIWTELRSHRNIVECYTVTKCLSFNATYLVLEYVKGNEDIGVSLRNWINKKVIKIETAIDFAIQICAAMDYAQKVLPGLVHCDLKPENILVTFNNIVKVTDFGISKIFENTIYENNGSGSYPYMSPEQVRREMLDHRSDIYAFGAILYEMLTGSMIFKVDKIEEFLLHHIDMEKIPVSPSSLVPLSGVLNELEVLVMRCLEKDRDKRPNSFCDIFKLLINISEKYTGRNLEDEDYKPNTNDESGDYIYELINKDFKTDSEVFPKAEAMDTLGYTERALDILDELPNKKRYRNIRASWLYHLGRFQEALELYDAELTKNPKSKMLWINKGRCLEELGRFEEALASYNKAHEFDQYDPALIFLRINLLDKLGRSDEI